MPERPTNAQDSAKPQGNPRRVILIFGWFCVAIGAPLLMWGAWYLIQAFASSSWPTVEGVVERVQIRRDTSGSGSTRTVSYRYTVEYAYEVGGTAYTSDKLEMGSGNTAGREPTHGEASAAARKRFPRGKAVTVYYDPDDPGMAVLAPGARLSNWGAYMPALLGLFFALVGGWMLYLAKSMPQRPAAPKRAA